MYAAEPLPALPLDEPKRDADGIWRQQRELAGWPEDERAQDQPRYRMTPRLRDLPGLHHETAGSLLRRWVRA